MPETAGVLDSNIEALGIASAVLQRLAVNLRRIHDAGGKVNLEEQAPDYVEARFKLLHEAETADAGTLDVAADIVAAGLQVLGIEVLDPEEE